MGFGLLFIGYFFLINITYYAYTDIIGAMVMLMALYKLGRFCRDFKHAAVADTVFAVFATGELVLAALGAFGILTLPESATAYIAAARYLIVFVITVLMLRGIRALADEVGADALATGAKTSIPLAAIYPIAAFLNCPFAKIFGAATPYIFLVAVIAVVVYHISNLITVYKAYMQICMPEDATVGAKKHGKRTFTDKIYDRIEQREKEYNEYKLGRAKERHKNKRKKK